MAQLSSPGVAVSVINESFYTPAAPGTVPLIVVASAENKQNSAGTGIAPGTTKANVGTAYLLTSQSDLGATFGDPIFEVDSGSNPVNAGELNEYGLQAAYSLLGVSASAYVIRADIDLNQLKGTAVAPSNHPANGTYWLDTAESLWGIYEWNGSPITANNGQTFINKKPIVVTDTSHVVSGSTIPKPGLGSIGSYAVVAVSQDITMYYKNTQGNWVEVGSNEWIRSWPTVVSGAMGTWTTGKTFKINGTTITTGATHTAAGLVTDISNHVSGVTASAVNGRLQLTSVNSILIEDGVSNAIGLSNIGLTAATYYPPALQISKHTQIPLFKDVDVQPRPTGSVWIKTTQNNVGSHLFVKRWNSTTTVFDTINAPMFPNPSTALNILDVTGGGLNLPIGKLYVKTNIDQYANPLATETIYRRSATGPTTITSTPITSNTFTDAVSYTFEIAESQLGSNAMSSIMTVTFIGTGSSSDADLVASAIQSAGFDHITAVVDNMNRVVIGHSLGGDFTISDSSGGHNPLVAMGFTSSGSSATKNLFDSMDNGTSEYTASLWAPLSYTAGITAPSSLTADGTLWYSSVHDEVDIMIHNGTTWVGYMDETNPYYGNGTDPAGPIVMATMPMNGDRSDHGDLVTGDLWVDSSDTANWGTVYRYNYDLKKWLLIDKADQNTENGILFADARWATNGMDINPASILELLGSNYLDPDAPDPALYPRGMLLWNLRRSGFNVKEFKQNYINTSLLNPRYPHGSGESMGEYYPHRWVTVSANQDDGSGTFGRKAQRKVVEIALKATVNSNQQIRDEESRVFNLIACPGYPELISAMIGLNYDRGLTAFVIGDTPARLTPDATSLLAWGMNTRGALEDNDLGGVSYDEYMAMFYPWGFTSDNFGRNIVVPPSHMILRTIALSDQVSYPWFAPAGVRRGGITNASAVGYVNADGEFMSVALNTGQRDTLYQAEINPITFLTGTGLVNYGQKTRAKGSSSLDRINVARLVCYLRKQLDRLAKPYIFEPNDKITRDQLKAAAESLMLELVGNRALYDYVVVCDTSNNTPSRIDRNELYLDIAIEPVKAVEFIYIPLRLENTGAIKALGVK
jgi:hypothetical protein